MYFFVDNMCDIYNQIDVKLRYNGCTVVNTRKVFGTVNKATYQTKKTIITNKNRLKLIIESNCLTFLIIKAKQRTI